MKGRGALAAVVLFGLLCGQVLAAPVHGPRAAAEGQRRASYTNPQKLALKLSDLPARFKQTVGTARSDAYADKYDHLAAGTTEKHGRITGFETKFEKGGAAGLLSVDDSVLAYRSASGAHWQILYAKGKSREPYHGQHFKAISIGRIGDETLAYDIVIKSGGFTFDIVSVIFRRGVYPVELSGVGVVGTFHASQVVNLAKVIDHRIASGH